MNRGAWPTTVHRVAQSRTRLKQLSMHHGPKLQMKIPKCIEMIFVLAVLIQLSSHDYSTLHMLSFKASWPLCPN